MNLNRLHHQPKKSLNLRTKLILLISFLVICILITLGILTSQFLSKTIENQIGKRALGMAMAVAKTEAIIDAFELDDPSSTIQSIVDPIQEETGAEYIVVGNKKGVRYSHPKPDRIEKKMVGGDNDRALLKGESYVTKKTGSLGLSVRGKVPIENKNGDIIGVVSVGFLNKDIQAIIKDEQIYVWLMIFLALLIGVIGAIIISHYIKKLLFNMEPEEISELVLQKEAILQSTKEGIIAINNKGEPTMVNKAALTILNSKDLTDTSIQPNHIKKIMHIFSNLKELQSKQNIEMLIGNTIVLVNCTLMKEKENIIGAVATFRSKTDIEHITKELSQIKQYANALRSQAHEFSNKMYTILGLLQLNKINQAKRFILHESDIQRNWLSFLTNNVADPLIHGLLQGKYNQANELGIRFQIDDNSSLSCKLRGKKQEALLTSLGNVIDNALESLQQSTVNEKLVSIYFTDVNKDIIFEIEDSGQGISEQHINHLFEQNFSTKKTFGRGYGLAISRKQLHGVNGEITYEKSNLGGALFTIIIPKENEGDKF